MAAPPSAPLPCSPFYLRGQAPGPRCPWGMEEKAAAGAGCAEPPGPQRAAAVPCFGICVDQDDILPGALRLIQELRPHWEPEQVRTKRFTDGITNKLVACYVEEDMRDCVLVRVYGERTELLVDRENEVRNFQLLRAHGCAPKLYCTFQNGLCYEYMQGVALGPEHIREPRLFRLIALEMAKIHTIHTNGSLPKPTLWYKMHNYFTLVRNEINPSLSAGVPKVEVLEWELAWLKEHLSQLDSPVVFCHNDLLCKNIIYDSAKGHVRFIDYEYAGYNYQAFDIGNHFNEFAALRPAPGRCERGGLLPVPGPRDPAAVAALLPAGAEGDGRDPQGGGAALRASQQVCPGISLLLGSLGPHPEPVLHHRLRLPQVRSDPIQPVLQGEASSLGLGDAKVTSLARLPGQLCSPGPALLRGPHPWTRWERGRGRGRGPGRRLCPCRQPPVAATEDLILLLGGADRTQPPPPGGSPAPHQAQEKVPAARPTQNPGEAHPSVPALAGTWAALDTSAPAWPGARAPYYLQCPSLQPVSLCMAHTSISQLCPTGAGAKTRQPPSLRPSAPAHPLPTPQPKEPCPSPPQVPAGGREGVVASACASCLLPKDLSSSPGGRL
ncbi:ethanolamine kinase 2 isoform X1 [Lepus europaeus]|uniref:ethanolamine kinase 2 isoform X1 n=1 Tax=Lepus europaeus TaxID=9983 RepID=UPI002B462EB5|nr:ethanolamine kinase 2 isoform X1 [Lepus europaeus]